MKQIDGANAIYVQFVSNKYSRLTSVSFYFDRKMKKGTTSANNTLESPALYAHSDGGQVPFDTIVTENAVGVKNEDAPQISPEKIAKLDVSDDVKRAEDITFAPFNGFCVQNLTSLPLGRIIRRNIDRYGG